MVVSGQGDAPYKLLERTRKVIGVPLSTVTSDVVEPVAVDGDMALIRKTQAFCGFDGAGQQQARLSDLTGPIFTQCG